MNLRSGTVAVCVTALSLFVTSCGGGINTTPIPVPSPVITAPAVAPLTAFTPVTTSAAASTTTTTTLPTLTPPAGVNAGTSASIKVPPLSAAGTAVATMSATAPAGAPVLSSIARSAQAVRGTRSESVPIVGLLYFGFEIDATSSTTYTLALPSFTLTLPSAYFAVTGTTYYMALYDPTNPAAGWQSRVETCVATASTTTLTCTGTGSLTVPNNVALSFALYAVSAAAPTPSPAPAGSPLPSPGASVTASPSPGTSTTPSPSPAPGASATASPTPGPAATMSPTPNPGPTTASFASTLTGSNQTIALPNINGITGSATVLASTAGVQLPAIAQAAAAHGFAPIGGVLLYSAFFAPSGAGFANGISVTFTLPSIQNGSRYMLASYLGGLNSWLYGVAGPGTVSGNTVSFQIPQTVNMQIGITYGFALYVLPPSPDASGSVSIASGATLTLPSANGAAGTLILGTASTTTTASVQLYTNPPPGIANPGTPFPAYLYYTFVPAASVTISGTTSGTFTPPTGYTGPGPAVPIYVEIIDTSNPTYGWFLKAAGPSCCNATASFSTTQTLNLVGGTTYAVGVYPSL